jgi:hypothetical protein
MTPEQYYGEVKKLGLTPTKFDTVFLDSEKMTYRIERPHDLTPEQREEHIALLKFKMGVGPRPFGSED